jgi:hypothetical protein
LGLSVLALTACGSSDDSSPKTNDSPGDTTATFPKALLPSEVVADLPLIAPKSDLDLPVFSGIVDVNPGEDVTFCTFTDVVVDETTIFGESFGAQSPMGHHGILQYTTTPQEPHTGSCGDAMDGQMLLGGTGGKAVAQSPTLPTNYGVEVPAGAQLVINHHWINTSDEPVRGQTMMLARRLASGGDTIKAGNLPMLGIGWQIPAQGELEYSTECKYQEDVSYVLALGHMHEWGQHVKIEVERGDGSTESLIDENWSADSATTAGGGTIFSLDDPYLVKKGDTVRLTCNWANTSNAAVAFPREMCVFFGYTIDANYFCANGTWMSPAAANAAGMGQDVINHL